MSAGERTTRPSDGRLEVLDVRPEALDDPVRVRLAQLLRPGAVAGVELAGRVAGRPLRQLLQLDPDDPAVLGAPRGVDGHRLAADDRRLGREQPAGRLVDRARDAVEARA